MINRLQLSVIQCRSAITQSDNITRIAPFIEAAIDEGAQLISLPEAANTMSYKKQVTFYGESDDPFVQMVLHIAAKHKVWIHLGSALIQENNKLYNRTLLIDDNANIHSRYNKIHMFDVNLKGEAIRESDSYTRGDKLAVATTPWGKIGLSICYDLRFPHLYRALAQQGCRLLMIPAAFTRVTGEAHWHTLVRARAIENSAWVVAANQYGKHQDGRETYGHSLIVNPWGEIIAEAQDQLTQVTTTIDLSLADKVRQQIPAWNLQHSL